MPSTFKCCRVQLVQRFAGALALVLLVSISALVLRAGCPARGLREEVLAEDSRQPFASRGRRAESHAAFQDSPDLLAAKEGAEGHTDITQGAKGQGLVKEGADGHAAVKRDAARGALFRGGGEGHPVSKKDGGSDTGTESSAEESPQTTEALSGRQVWQRKVRFASCIAAGVLLLFLAVGAATAYKGRKLEMPWIRCKGCAWPPITVERLTLVDWSAPVQDVAWSVEASGAESMQYKSVPAEEPAERGITTGSAVEGESAQKVASGTADQHQAVQRTTLKANMATIWKARRKRVLAALFVSYVGICAGYPFAKKDEVSCQHGYFWETHIPFLAMFFITKMAELYFYTFDPSIDGMLPTWKFFLLFVASFSSYVDGYQDSMSIQIVAACGEVDDPIVNSAVARMLSWSMALTFGVGVVLLQWVVVGYFALAHEESLAILAKLVHMDALAACISVPDEKMWMWHAVSAIRTFGEDIPQGLQQTIFITKVRVNRFMLASIVFSVLCSLKALYEACMRAASAVGLLEKAALSEEERKKAIFSYYTDMLRKSTTGDLEAEVGPIHSLLQVGRDLEAPVPENKDAWLEDGMFCYGGGDGHIVVPSIDLSEVLSAHGVQQVARVEISVHVNSDAYNRGLGVVLEASPLLQLLQEENDPNFYSFMQARTGVSKDRRSNAIKFHPGMKGGQLRVEGKGGFGNKDIGFTPGNWKATNRRTHILKMVLGTEGRNEISFTDAEGNGMWAGSWQYQLFDGKHSPAVFAWLDLGDREDPVRIGPVSMRLRAR